MNRKELSKREKEVMRGVLDGHTFGQIADKLGVAKKTVASHACRLYGKLNVSTRIGLVKRCIELGWLTHTKRGKAYQWTQHT